MEPCPLALGRDVDMRSRMYIPMSSTFEGCGRPIKQDEGIVQNVDLGSCFHLNHPSILQHNLTSFHAKGGSFSQDQLAAMRNDNCGACFKHEGGSRKYIQRPFGACADVSNVQCTCGSQSKFTMTWGGLGSKELRGVSNGHHNTLLEGHWMDASSQGSIPPPSMIGGQHVVRVQRFWIPPEGRQSGDQPQSMVASQRCMRFSGGCGQGQGGARPQHVSPRVVVGNESHLALRL